MPTARARYQSAGAVHIASRSPKPARFISRRPCESLQVHEQGVRPARGDGALGPALEQHRHVVGEGVDRGGRLHHHEWRSAGPPCGLLADVGYGARADHHRAIGPGDGGFGLGEGLLVGVQLGPLPPMTARLTSKRPPSRRSASSLRSPPSRRMGVASMTSATRGAARSPVRASRASSETIWRRRAPWGRSRSGLSRWAPASPRDRPRSRPRASRRGPWGRPRPALPPSSSRSLSVEDGLERGTPPVEPVRLVVGGLSASFGS